MKTQNISCILMFGLLTVSEQFLAAQNTAAPVTAKADSADSVMGIPKSELAPSYSGGVGEVVKLARSGVDESVVIAFVKNSAVPYKPGAEEIIELRDAGISSQIITAMLQRGGELRSQAASAASAAALNNVPTSNPATQPPPAVTYAEPVYTAPASTVVYFGGSPADTYPVVYYNYGGLGYTHYYYHDPFYFSCVPRVGYYGGFGPRMSIGANFGGFRAGGFSGGSHFNSGAHFGGGSRHR